jgi:hypothetical protein
MEKRYQVFVSSTYADLKEERRSVIQTLMEMDCIPAGMELFPAADEEQFEFIKRVIDDFDYYIVIVGGRYGSATSEGVSYTEKEYDYAREKGLKVIALLHEDPDQLPVTKSETDEEARARLAVFREKLTTNRLSRFWKRPPDLPGLVALSLQKTIKTFPAIGWVRANTVASEQILTELNELRKENTALRTQTAPPQIGRLAGLDDKFQIRFVEKIEPGYPEFPWDISLSWADIFYHVSPLLRKGAREDRIKTEMTAILHRKKGRRGASDSRMDDDDFLTVVLQLKVLGLTREEIGPGGLYWFLTLRGERLMMELRTARSKDRPDEA